MINFFGKQLARITGLLNNHTLPIPPSAPLSFLHAFDKGTDPNAPSRLLLHGTDQDENELLPLDRAVAPRAPLLSPRGKVLENGSSRYFRRFAPNVFDEADVRLRAEELADFIIDACKHYGISNPIALGYSNGANIVVAVMLLRPETLAGAILLRPTMVPFSQVPLVDLAGRPILMLSGASDPTTSPKLFSQLSSLLHRLGSLVDTQVLPAGHELSQADIEFAWAWYQARKRIE